MTDNRSLQIQQYTTGEEILNSVTHGIGTILSVAGLVILIVLATMYGDSRHIVSFSIFGGALIVLYASSTLYHSFSRPSVKTVFKKLDHSAIFLLIAGTYTPFLLVSLRGAWGWSLFGVLWTLAVIGVTIKFITIFRFRGLFVVMYLIMGWLGIIAIKQILGKVPPPGLILLLIGGLSYTIGVIFYCSRRLPFNHGIWHMFVLCGSVFHYFSVLCILKQG